MRLGIASEHAGYELKEFLKGQLIDKGYEVVDFGCNSGQPIDYPPICFALGKALTEGQIERGILICGTGIGVSIAANKVPGVRAALCRSTFEAEMSRRHNDANVLCLGAWITAMRLAWEMTQVWLESGFDAGRHSRRIGLISEYEKNQCKSGGDQDEQFERGKTGPGAPFHLEELPRR